jgi:NAD(P)-dependent dehydrogenase (short-subunit alcohol dehydrogenase family)
MSHDFTGRVALVTGAGSGIGAACAKLLAAAGAQVVVSDLDPAAAKAIAGQIVDAGGGARPEQVDVTDPASLDATVDATVSAYGRLDLGINNAGITSPGAPTGDYPVDRWQRIIDVNLSGVFYSMRAEIPAMLDAGGGAIVNMASVLGLVGAAGAPAYVAAKHGVIGLTKVAALDYATKGIRVNAVAPGFVDTDFMADERGRRPRGLAIAAPNQRFGQVDEVARVVLFLLSDEASLITGSCHVADGGYTSR